MGRGLITLLPVWSLGHGLTAHCLYGREGRALMRMILIRNKVDENDSQSGGRG